MGKVKFTQTMSLDGYTAGPEQTREEPLGKGGEELHEWMFATRTFREMGGREGGDTGLDDERMRRWNENVGAHIMGRNMFGPVRGEWGDEDWRGWWGDDPPYHAPVFVLTHHAREPVEMEGGTTFHFVTDGIEASLAHAKEAAGEKDVANRGRRIDVAAVPARRLGRRDGDPRRSHAPRCRRAPFRESRWRACRIRVRRASRLTRRGALQLCQEGPLTPSSRSWVPTVRERPLPRSS